MFPCNISVYLSLTELPESLSEEMDVARDEMSESRVSQVKNTVLASLPVDIFCWIMTPPKTIDINKDTCNQHFIY